MEQTKDLGVKLPAANRVDEQFERAMLYATVVFVIVCGTIITLSAW